MSLPEPLVPKEVSLEAYPSFQLNTSLLINSEFLAKTTGDEFKAAIKLWCAAWKQSPASSLPNDDKILADWSGLGSKWKKSREKVLHGWKLHNDGRLYHPVLAKDALRCWDSHLVYTKKKVAEKEKKERQRSSNVPGDIPRDKHRDKSGTQPVIPERQERDVLGEIGANININNNYSVPNGTGDGDPPPLVLDVGKRTWDFGYELLASYEIPKSTAGKLLGKWLKSAGSVERLFEVLQEAAKERRGEILPYVEARFTTKKQPTVQGLGRNLQSMEGGPFSNENGEFHVSGWAQTLGIDAVAEQMLKAKSSGWDRAKTMAHLNNLAGSKSAEIYKNTKKTTEITPGPNAVEDPNWVAVRAAMYAEDPENENKTRSFLPMIHSVKVNGTSVKMRASTRFAAGHIEKNFGPKLLELFKVQKPGIEIVEVGL